MASNLLEQMKTIHPVVLTEVVRKDQHDSSMEILDWTVEPLGPGSLGANTCGLFRFTGQSKGRSGIQQWNVVLKCLRKSGEDNQRQDGWSYWKREILALQSGLLSDLAPGLRAPRCYGVIDNESNSWIWMEFIQEMENMTWNLERFQYTARQLSLFQGAYLRGMMLPDAPWLSRSFFHSLWADDDWVMGFMNPASENTIWKLPSVQSAFNQKHSARILELVQQKNLFFDANERLPQVLCHHDAYSRNFLWSCSSQSNEKELALIDWSYCGVGALGNDLGKLVSTSLYFFDYDPYDADTLESALMESYLAGVSDLEIEIDPRLVRLGYLISTSFWLAAAMPILLTNLSPGDEATAKAMYGRSSKEVHAGWVHLTEFGLERADEARRLIRELGQ